MLDQMFVTTSESSPMPKSVKKRNMPRIFGMGNDSLVMTNIWSNIVFAIKQSTVTMHLFERRRPFEIKKHLPTNTFFFTITTLLSTIPFVNQNLFNIYMKYTKSTIYIETHHTIFNKKTTQDCSPTKLCITAGTGLFTASENGWEIYWSLFKFPNHLHRETIV